MVSINDQVKKRMRILFLAHRTPLPPNKGEKLRALWELRTLSRRHEIDLFCFCDDAEDESHLALLGNFCREFYAERRSWFWSRVRATSALIHGEPFTTAFFYSRRMSHKIRAAIQKNAYDRIFVFSSAMAQYVESSDLPTIVDFVDVDSDKWQQYATRRKWPWAWLARAEASRLAAYEHRLLRHSEVVLVCTEAEVRLLKPDVPANVHVLPNYIDVSYYDPAKVRLSDEVRSWQPYVLFSGSMDYFPNIDAALYFYHEIFPLIRSMNPELKFVIAGRSPHASIRRLAADPAVRITGSVFDIRPYLCGASAAVAPLRIARGIQNKILESLAAGVPVVASAVIAPSLERDVFGLVNYASTAGAFADTVLEVLREEPGKRRAERRVALSEHMKSLALDSQLHRIVRAAGGITRRESESALVRANA